MADTPISSDLTTNPTVRRRRYRVQSNSTVVLMLAPAVLTLLLIGIFPLLYVLQTSFKLYQLTQPYLGTPWVGFDNYTAVLTDGLFWSALWRTLLFFLMTIPLQLVLGVGIALLLDGTRWRFLAGTARVLLVLPIAVTPTVLGLLGRLVFNRDFGVVNWVIEQFGLGPVSWLGSPWPAMVTIALTDTWQWTPFVALVALAGLTAVPHDIVEASKLDTNKFWELFRHIQLPYLLPGLTAVLIIRTADIIKLFDMVFVLTRGGPGVSTELISIYVQRVAFRIFDIGMASAQAVLLLILCIVLAQVYIRVFYKEVEEA